MSTAIPGYDTKYDIIKAGSGNLVEKGDTVTVHVTGVVGETGKKFCSTKDPGQQTFSFKAAVGEVITGWDQGLLGMRIGEQRKLIIPGKEGYGESGFPAWGIPENATLEYTLECVSISDCAGAPGEVGNFRVLSPWF